MVHQTSSGIIPEHRAWCLPQTVSGGAQKQEQKLKVPKERDVGCIRMPRLDFPLTRPSGKKCADPKTAWEAEEAASKGEDSSSGKARRKMVEPELCIPVHAGQG